ncbi:hypothetical protein L596_005587 [Steinernema carpocapsae]|uniref:Chromo shadow domain-containing protein n=1 Tax=Steinernema carpocapsae TaxID=34508 RepID=A0A4U8V3H7_STECR|nr:hypothetical protein L596_005587 [Steinernema carpocapsae]
MDSQKPINCGPDVDSDEERFDHQFENLELYPRELKSENIEESHDKEEEKNEDVKGHDSGKDDGDEDGTSTTTEDSIASVESIDEHDPSPGESQNSPTGFQREWSVQSIISGRIIDGRHSLLVRYHQDINNINIVDADAVFERSPEMVLEFYEMHLNNAHRIYGSEGMADSSSVTVFEVGDEYREEDLEDEDLSESNVSEDVDSTQESESSEDQEEGELGAGDAATIE